MIPLHNRVLLKHLESTRDSIWLPDDAGFLQRGLVLKVGETCQYVQVGDVVMFKADEAMRLRVPVEENAVGFKVPFGVEPEHLGALPEARVPKGETEETLHLVSEPGIYLVLEREPSD